MDNNANFVETVPVGIVQTTLDQTAAWRFDAQSPKISASEDARVWREICKAIRAFQDGNSKPRIVILPELTLPRTRLFEFERLVCALNVIAFVGVDYRLDVDNCIARNEGLVFIPQGFWNERPSTYCSRVVFGKSYPAPGEETKLRGLVPPWNFRGDENVYVFDVEKYGSIGVSICYDFMDLERALLFRGRIQHLFVLAYNRDLGMFQSLANSLSRTVYCNVIVCNTGFYGGTIAVSPFHEPHRRTIYAHDGKGLFTSQVIDLPVRDLKNALGGNMVSDIKKESSVPRFKHRPPGL